MRFLAVSLTALLIASSARPDDFQDQALAGVVALGGQAKLDEKLDEMARVSATFEKADDKILLQLAKMPAIGAISISDATKVSEVGFAALKELPDLQKLIVGKGNLVEKAAAAIGTLRTLDTLVLIDTKLNDAGIAGMKRLTNLKVLDVLNSLITDKGLTTILSYTKLEDLNLSGTRVTDTGILTLQALVKLKVLRVVGTKVTPKGVTAIEEVRGKALTVRY